MPKVIISDETSSGNVINSINLNIEEDKITLRELITMRVTREVESYLADPNDYNQNLVLITIEEKILNEKEERTDYEYVDVKKQIYLALEGFAQNAFFVIVEDTQIEALDETITIGDSTHVSFIKLIPLAGG